MGDPGTFKPIADAVINIVTSTPSVEERGDGQNAVQTVQHSGARGRRLAENVKHDCLSPVNLKT